jgi:polysaccharide export outer membrane protein
MLGGVRRLFRSLRPSIAILVTLFVLGPFPVFSQQKLETAEETNERLRQLANAFRGKQGDYIIGSGDLVRIEVFDVPELSREVRVSESGYISLPLLPVKVRAGGLTAFQLEEKLAELLRGNGLVSHPQVTVFLKEQRSQPITVIGAVRRPMVYQVIRPTTLLEVLSEAGGIADDAGSVVMITRGANQDRAPAATNENTSMDTMDTTDSEVAAGSQTITVALRDLLDSGDPKFNIPLFGGDVVRVPRAGIVYVVGAVERPGGFTLQNDGEQMSVLRVIALAQGMKPSAKPNEAVIIRKDVATGKKTEMEVNLNKIMQRKAEDVHLVANDILFVPDSTGKRALRRTGEVALGLTTGIVILRGAR